MEQLQQLADPTSRISRNISFRAGRLARSGAVPDMETEDIEQELRLDLIRRAPNYDPAKATFDTFADRVAANRIASLAEATHAKRVERTMLPLDAPVGNDPEDHDLTLAEVLSETSSMHPGEDFIRVHGPGLRGDIGRLMAALCPVSRRVSIAVSQMSVAEAARHLGLHRSSIYERLASIRETAIDLGLGDYFETSPTVRAPRR